MTQPKPRQGNFNVHLFWTITNRGPYHRSLYIPQLPITLFVPEVLKHNSTPWAIFLSFILQIMPTVYHQYWIIFVRLVQIFNPQTISRSQSHEEEGIKWPSTRLHNLKAIHSLSQFIILIKHCIGRTNWDLRTRYSRGIHKTNVKNKSENMQEEETLLQFI